MSRRAGVTYVPVHEQRVEAGTYHMVRCECADIEGEHYRLELGSPDVLGAIVLREPVTIEHADVWNSVKDG